MTSQFLRRSALVATAIVVVALTGLALAAGPTAAQTDATNVTNSETPAPVEGTVGPLEIRDYKLEDGTFTVVVYANDATPYALSDALGGTRSSGVTSIAYKSGALPSGLTRLTLDVQTVDGEGAVTLSTSNEMVRIQTGAVDAGRPPVPFSHAALALILASTGSGYYAFKRGKEKMEEDDEPEVTRLA